MPPKHRRGHSAIFNTSVTPSIPAFQANVQEYDPVAQDEEPAEKPAPTPAEIDFDEALHTQGCPRCAARSRLSQRRLPWMVATGMLAVLCLWLFMSQPAVPPATSTPAPPLAATPAAPAPTKAADKGASQAKPSKKPGRLGTYEEGFFNDLEAARSAIALEEVQFSGSPVFAADGQGSIPPKPGHPSYVGTPSPAIDAAWDELVADRYFLLSDAEAEAAWGPDYQRWWVNNHGGYLAGIDALHALHCLNHLRQALDPEYYTHPRLTVAGTEWHHDHCVDHLRQLVMCHGDATPIPSRYVAGIHQAYVATNRAHTCRDFGALQAFARARARGPLKVPPRNQTGKGPNAWELAHGAQP